MATIGRLLPFAETGTEGVVWSLQDAMAPGYDGLRCIADGDSLTIYDENGVAWAGIVSLEYDRLRQPYPLNPDHGQQAFDGLWVHGFQRDLEPPVWASFFFQHYLAKLDDDVPPHELVGPSATMQARLDALDAKRQQQLFRTLQHAWIWWWWHQVDGEVETSVDGTGGGHTNFGLTEAEALQLLGGASAEALREIQRHRRNDVIPDVFLRAGLLAGIVGQLELRFGQNMALKIKWLNETNIAGRPARTWLFDGPDGIGRVRDYLITSFELPGIAT